MVSEEIDFARQPAGSLEHSLLSGGLEEVELGPGPSKTVEQVCRELVASERGEMESDDDALREGFMDGHGETAAQLALAEQEQAQSVFRIHVVVRE